MEISIQSRNDRLMKSCKDCMYINFDCMNVPTGYIVICGNYLYVLLIPMDICIKCLYDLTIIMYEYFTVYKYCRYIKMDICMYVYQQYI